MLLVIDVGNTNMEFGVYVINNDSLPSPHMIGRAKALKETSTELRGRLRYAVYDDAIRRQLFREKRLKNIMGAALQNRDFQAYLQPKYRTESETIGGAEALVRWMSAEGMIYPDEFISLFEKTGSSSSWTFGCLKRFASASGRGSTPGCPR